MGYGSDAVGIHLLDNTVQKYDWGSRTAIPEFLGAPNPSREPFAELWIGAHDRAPSKVLQQGRRIPLNRLIAEDPTRWLGPRIEKQFGRMPFLLKVLAAAEPLSIQCHPSVAQAQAGFALEESSGLPRTARTRNYRDDNHKPELMCALSTFTALKGFRAQDVIAADLRQLQIPELTEAAEQVSVAAMYRHVMELPLARKETIAALAAERARALEADSFQWIARLAEIHPKDIGVLTPAFLNLVELSRDEAIYLGAGELHAYLGGVGVELMANSDNVIRGGLTQKHVDVDELLRILDPRTGEPEVLHAKSLAPGLRTFETPAPDFALSIVDLAADTPQDFTTDGIELVLVADGHATFVPAGGAAVQASKGGAVVVAGAVPAYHVEGSARLYRARGRPTDG